MRSIMVNAVLMLSFLQAVAAQGILSFNEEGEAPSRNYDVLHYRIEVTLDEIAKSVKGRTDITLLPLSPNFRTIALHAANMNVERVTLGRKQLPFDTTSHRLWITLDRPYSFDETLVISIDYSCTPKRGMTFTGPDSAYPNRRWQIWSQGEDTTNHFWFPCYDSPNDMATSEVIATVNGKFTVLSNGKLVGVKEDKKKGTKRFHWKQSKPHVSYLIMVAAGEYAVLRDKAGKLPLEFYAYPDDTLNARITFRETAGMIRLFNEKIGFDYPWEKYGQIILQDHFGGMENTGATTLADGWAVPDARARLDGSPLGLIAHELAHQWWGDVVTCKDWRHIWLNESFASYFDPLYFEHALGRDEFDYMMYDRQQAGIRVDTARGRKPIVSLGSYGENVYPRGASVLHMLRFLLGDKLFWRGINHYITKHQFQSVETNDFKTAIEEATGQNLYWFFDQWVYKAGHPVFEVSYSWSDSAKAVLLTVKQTQTMDSLTGVFRTPVDVEIASGAGIATHRVNILSADTTFVLASPDKPQLVIFDRGNWLLKELKFDKSPQEWRYQALSAANPIDRVRALQKLAGLSNAEEFVPVFADRMERDPFWGVRREAISQAGKIESKNDAMKEQLKVALIAAYKDAKASVRDAAMSALGKFKGSDVVKALKAALKDSSYGVITSALRSLAKSDSANALAVVKTYLEYPSFQNRVLNSALWTLATLDSTQAVSIAMGRARYGELTGTRHTALGILERHGKGRADVRALYVALLADKNDGVRNRAVSALGEQGDEAVIPALEKIAGDKENSASDAAKRSIERIRKRVEEKVVQGGQ